MYVCRKIRLYFFLKEKGFDCEFDRQDVNNPKYKVWVFKDSPELREAIEEYYSSDSFKSKTKITISKKENKKESNNKIYACTKIRLCEYLINHGYMYIREATDIKNPSRKVWLFNDSEELKKCVEEYYNRKEFINRE